jgi:xanthine dehydrogenase large subunit
MSAVGKNLPHDSADGHVSGESIYIDDMPPSRGELLVDFYHHPVAHARVKSLDLKAAAAVPGVVRLFTYKDLDGENLFGPIVKDEVLLVENVIEFMGQPLVVIAAESREAIKLAKAAIRCEVEELPPVLTIKEAQSKKLFLEPTRRIKRGDAEAAFKTADHIHEGVFFCKGQDHFYLEGQAAIAYPGEHDQLVVHSSTQNPTEVQEVIAHVLGLRANQVVCITKRMGGGFGGKECQATHPAAMAALVAHKTKRPARIVYEKDFDMQVTGKRHPFRNEYKVGFMNDGRIVALKAHLYSDGGTAHDLSLAVMSRAMTHVDNAYYLENAEIIGTVCKTNHPPNTAFRGFGGPQGIATIENIIEEIAVILKKDALAVRRINLYGIEDRNVTPYGEVVPHNTLPRIFDELEKSSTYAARRIVIDQFNKESKTHLKGLAFTAVKFGISFNTKFLNQANALVNIYLDGSIQVSTGATEMGQGVNTNIKQLVAGEFDIDPDYVIMMATSTEKNNNTSATAASSATDLNGSAAVNACKKLRERMTEVAAKHLADATVDLQAAPGSVVFEGGMIFDKRRPDKKLSWKELVKLSYMERVSLGERGFYATAGLDWAVDAGPEKLCSGNPFLYYTTGAAVSEVLIDRFTGDLRVERVDLLMDVGTPINPGIARGQVVGAFIQGLGWVTTEDLRYKETGELLSHSPTTYKIPNIQDLPAAFNVKLLDASNPMNLKGTKAVGEPPLCLGLSVWAAVKNGLSYVSGGTVPKLHLPATNEEILLRLTEQAARQASTTEKSAATAAR